MLNLEAREERNAVAVQLDLADQIRHDMGHELAHLLMDGRHVDQQFADVRCEVVTDGADD